MKRASRLSPIIAKTDSDFLYSRRASLRDYGPANPLYVAHRGSAALYPEESSVAYNRSLADGEVCLEGDAQVLADGSLGLMHDPTVDRTTTGTGNVNTFTAAAFKALTMDSGVWLGSNYGDTLTPLLVQDWIDVYKGKAILCPEDKDFASMGPLVRAMINSGVPYDQGMIQCFKAQNLAAAVAAGYQACGLTAAGSPTPALIASTGAQWAAVAAGESLAPYIAVGLKTMVYTVNRRAVRDAQLAQGCAGFFCDDPSYMRSSAAMSSVDWFARQTWAPGMLAMNSDDGMTLANRGVFAAPNWWGYTSALPGTYVGCLMGYMCPIASPQNCTFSFNAAFDAVNAGDATRWLSLFLGTSDDRYLDGSDAATAGYQFLVRQNGSMSIWRKDKGVSTVQLNFTGGFGAFTLGVEYSFTITITPTALTLARVSGGAVISSITVADSTYRGTYFHLGRNGVACRFRSLSIA